MKVHRWEDLKRARLSKDKVAAVERRARQEALRLTLKELLVLARKSGRGPQSSRR